MEFLEKLRKRDNFWIGFILGILIPGAIFPFVLPVDYQTFGFMGKTYWQVVLMLSPIILSRCIFPNALVFFLLIWGDFDKASKGILYSTIGLVGILIIIRLFT